jgi:adenylate kinase
VIIFVGAAGSGKSIQGRLLAQKIGATYFSMGEFLRSHVDPNLQKKMLTGELINDEEAIKAVNDALPRLSNANEEYILDGFPRTTTQADWLIKEIERGRFVIDGVIHLQASPEIIVPRLLERKRPDDYLEAINQRISEYNNTILPILERLKVVNVKIHDINAEKPIDVVNKDIITTLGLGS